MPQKKTTGFPDVAKQQMEAKANFSKFYKIK
jgi:hypothetical protein